MSLRLWLELNGKLRTIQNCSRGRVEIKTAEAVTISCSVYFVVCVCLFVFACDFAFTLAKQFDDALTEQLFHCLPLTVTIYYRFTYRLCVLGLTIAFIVHQNRRVVKKKKKEIQRTHNKNEANQPVPCNVY